MTTMVNVGEAVIELRKELEMGTKAETAVRLIAEDYSLNPILLRRKFEESYKKTPEAYTSAPTTPLPTTSDVAMAVATAWSKEFMGVSPHLGKPFTFQGERFLFVVIQSGCPKWGIKAVRVKDGARRQITLHSWAEIAPQLQA